MATIDKSVSRYPHEMVSLAVVGNYLILFRTFSKIVRVERITLGDGDLPAMFNLNE